jgi:hypothetical protein
VPEGTKSGGRGYSSSLFSPRDLIDKLPVRTEKNVKDSDGTLILTVRPVNGGTARTLAAVQKLKKVYVEMDLSYGGGPDAVKAWLKANQIKTLNVAEPRESEVQCPSRASSCRELCCYRKPNPFLFDLRCLSAG